MGFPTCPAGALTGVAGPAGGEVLVPPRWFGARLGASLAMAVLGAPFPAAHRLTGLNWEQDTGAAGTTGTSPGSPRWAALRACHALP